jgi:hypothetical protein
VYQEISIVNLTPGPHILTYLAGHRHIYQHTPSDSAGNEIHQVVFPAPLIAEPPANPESDKYRNPRGLSFPENIALAHSVMEVGVRSGEGNIEGYHSEEVAEEAIVRLENYSPYMPEILEFRKTVNFGNHQDSERSPSTKMHINPKL